MVLTTPPQKKIIHLLTIQASRMVGMLGCKFVVFDCITYFCTIILPKARSNMLFACVL